MDETRMRWRKSSFSAGDNGNCVELGNTGAIRDSKNPAGPVLPIELGGFLAAIKHRRVDR